jgi:hypothetical protein
MLVGAASFHPPKGADASWAEVLEPQVGPMTIRRVYESAQTGIPASWETSAARLDVGRRAVAWSMKPPVAEFATGAHDGRLRALLRSIPDDGMPKWLMPWHEGDVKVRRGDYKRETWLAAFRRFADLVHAEQIPHTYVTPCFANWLWLDPQQRAGDPELWWLDDAYDVLAVDGYNATPASMFDQPARFALEHNVPWAVAEVGMFDGPDTSVKARWIADTAAYCAERDAVFQCWFDSPEGFPVDKATAAPTPSSSAASIAAAVEVCATYYQDPREDDVAISDADIQRIADAVVPKVVEALVPKIFPAVWKTDAIPAPDGNPSGTNPAWLAQNVLVDGNQKTREVLELAKQLVEREPGADVEAIVRGVLDGFHGRMET